MAKEQLLVTRGETGYKSFVLHCGSLVPRYSLWRIFRRSGYETDFLPLGPCIFVGIVCHITDKD